MERPNTFVLICPCLQMHIILGVYIGCIDSVREAEDWSMHDMNFVKHAELFLLCHCQLDYRMAFVCPRGKVIPAEKKYRPSPIGEQNNLPCQIGKKVSHTQKACPPFDPSTPIAYSYTMSSTLTSFFFCLRTRSAALQFHDQAVDHELSTTWLDH